MGIEGNGSLIVIWYLGSLHRCGKWILFDGQKRRTQTGRRTPAPFTREMQEMSNTNWEDQTHITRRAKAKKNKKQKNKNTKQIKRRQISIPSGLLETTKQKRE